MLHVLNQRAGQAWAIAVYTSQHHPRYLPGYWQALKLLVTGRHNPAKWCGRFEKVWVPRYYTTAPNGDKWVVPEHHRQVWVNPGQRLSDADDRVDTNAYTYRLGPSFTSALATNPAPGGP